MNTIKFAFHSIPPMISTGPKIVLITIHKDPAHLAVNPAVFALYFVDHVLFRAIFAMSTGYWLWTVFQPQGIAVNPPQEMCL